VRPRTIYLDHHATTPVDPAVVAAMLPYLTEKFGNPSSRQHVFGQEAHAAVEDARGHVAALIGAEPAEIVFTSGATESDNLALRGAARALAARGRHVVTTAIEHPAVLEPCRTLEKDGFEVTVVGVGAEGLVAPDDVAAALRPDTVLVSVMAANNEIGTIQPVEEIGRLCRDRGIVFHSDAVQALGRMPIAVDQWHTDLVSLSAHKMYGPKGVGALYVRRARRPRLRLVPQNEGGGQEKGVRSGTLNVPGIVGFGEAARLAKGALAGGEHRCVARPPPRWPGGAHRGSDGQRLARAPPSRQPSCVDRPRGSRDVDPLPGRPHRDFLRGGLRGGGREGIPRAPRHWSAR